MSTMTELSIYITKGDATMTMGDGTGERQLSLRMTDGVLDLPQGDAMSCISTLSVKYYSSDSTEKETITLNTDQLKTYTGLRRLILEGIRVVIADPKCLSNLEEVSMIGCTIDTQASGYSNILAIIANHCTSVQFIKITDAPKLRENCPTEWVKEPIALNILQ